MSDKVHQIADIVLLLLLAASIYIDISRSRRLSIERERRTHLRHSATFDFCDAVSYIPVQEIRDRIIDAWTREQRELAIAMLANEISCQRIALTATITAREVEKETRARIKAHNDAGQ
jgi:hypothetical protein